MTELHKGDVDNFANDFLRGQQAYRAGIEHHIGGDAFSRGYEAEGEATKLKNEIKPSTLDELI